jgi:hypothetical protein
MINLLLCHFYLSVILLPDLSAALPFTVHLSACCLTISCPAFTIRLSA